MLGVKNSLPTGSPGHGAQLMRESGVMPGGGVPPCLYSGRHALELPCRDDGRPFTAADAYSGRYAPRSSTSRRANSTQNRAPSRARCASPSS